MPMVFMCRFKRSWECLLWNLTTGWPYGPENWNMINYGQKTFNYQGVPVLAGVTHDNVCVSQKPSRWSWRWTPDWVHAGVARLTISFPQLYINRRYRCTFTQYTVFLGCWFALEYYMLYRCGGAIVTRDCHMWSDLREGAEKEHLPAWMHWERQKRALSLSRLRRASR